MTQIALTLRTSLRAWLRIQAWEARVKRYPRGLLPRALLQDVQACIVVRLVVRRVGRDEQAVLTVRYPWTKP